MVEANNRPVWAEIDLSAVRHNVALLAARVAPAALCAVVKADGYGHGAVPVARAAIDAGAAGLAVALVDEGTELREAAVQAPVLVLSEPPLEAMDAAVAAGLTVTISSPAGAAALAGAARRAGTQARVHVKVDTGMHRAGVAPATVGDVVATVEGERALRLEGVWTHLAVADRNGAEDDAFTAAQLERFERSVAGLHSRPTVLHAANSAAALRFAAARFDMVRCGIAVYGLAPSAAMRDAGDEAAQTLGALRPALSLRAKVSAVRELDAGARPSYGRLRPMPNPGVVATVPLGYADGARRALFTGGGEVLVGGRRRPLAGMISMDQLVIDCGRDAGVAAGDEVVLLGRQGDEEIRVGEWAARTGTIDYEVVCGIGPRVPRIHVNSTADGRRDTRRP
ncbi:MAG: alanine racemase [Acidimicrobiales bacterium]